MDIEQAIIQAFGLTSEELPSDDFIVENDNLMGLNVKVDFLVYLPAYMLWCVRHRDIDQNLVGDCTINAIAEFGRCNNPNLAHMNFKFLCNAQQKSVVALFLRWALLNLEFCNEDQINRSLSHWD